MHIGEYQVTIPEGRELTNGYVEMRHMQQYTVRMVNFSDRRCNAYVTIDGLPQGSYRIRPGSSFPLERSIHDKGKFTFLATGTIEAAQAGESSVAKAVKGVVTVRFVPEKKEPVYTPQSLGFESYRGGSKGVSKGAGMTGLTGESSQRFVTAEEMEEDPDVDVTISLRLVTASTVRPLPGRLANAVPPSVE